MRYHEVMITTPTEAEFTEALRDVLFCARQVTDAEVTSISTFEEAGVLTTNAGLVLRQDDGTEWQITIVQSR